MKTIVVAWVMISFIAVSCGTSRSHIFSTTYIEPKKSFVLDDNEHESYQATVKNVSNDDLVLFQMSGGAKQLIQRLHSGKSVSITVNKNVALYIDNNSERKATVEISIASNVNLSMGYKN